MAKLDRLYDPSGNGAINTGYNPNYPKWSVVEEEGSSARADVVRSLFNAGGRREKERGEGVSLRNGCGNGCHVPNICSGNRSTLVP